MTDHDVFLSYSRDDLKIMNRLRDDLRAAGLKVWTDEGIPLGSSSWKLEIEQGIRGSTCLVVLLSPDAAASRWVRAEIDFAEAQRKPIFPVLVRGEESEAVPFGLSTHQWIDLRDTRDYPQQFRRLTAALAHEVSDDQMRSATAYTPNASDPVSVQPRPAASPARTSRAVQPALLVLGIAFVVLLGAVLLYMTNQQQPGAPLTAEPTGRVNVVQAATPTPAALQAADGTRIAVPAFSMPEDWVRHNGTLVSIAAPPSYQQYPIDTEIFTSFARLLLPEYLPEQPLPSVPNAYIDLYVADLVSFTGIWAGIEPLDYSLPLEINAERFIDAVASMNFDVRATEQVTLPYGEMIRMYIGSPTLAGHGLLYFTLAGGDDAAAERSIFVIFTTGALMDADALLTFSEQVMATFTLAATDDGDDD